MSGGYLLYGDVGSGAVAVEAALVLARQPYDLIEAPTSEPDDPAGGDRVLAANPLRQVPALVLPSGETMTESAAILIWLAEQHPEAGLAPAAGDPARAAFLRWMAFVSAAIYSLYWVKDDPARLAPDPAAQPALVARTLDRISECWGMMEAQVSPGRYILGDRLTVLDLYVTVVSRFNPRRQRFYDVAPRLGEVVRRVDADPRLAAFWPARYPFDPGWDRPS
ncbi:MAG: glutathione S-transferase family protein [Alphaproteobacteria bacterium]|nr:glutathione S-transferase family protein [Alphaproteobacteria bacterium]MBU1516735.1 glutathione S-transferase family protein [Alphaproteobacteria bacterium]MBU2096064.1 glutathione S-transferase family protein [Alphaproteobacteria bacterium]MBU2149740.1 glutathione S-transferase family protein [Alphaproteobacteria bacterium]MBU2307361.1 glutathione S-transferase family protein [Alphaproteobacteria bacterium]